MERPNGRRRDQLRALLTRSPQENVSGADPGNHNDPLATEQDEQARRGEGQGAETVADLQVCIGGMAVTRMEYKSPLLP